jgi:two-component system sensor histidine kinase YesM
MKPILPIRSFFNNLKIKYKLLLSYVLLILLAVLTLTSLAYYKTSGMIEERVVESTKKSFEQANTFITYKLNSVKDVSSILFLNRELNQTLAKEGPDYKLAEQIDDYHKLLEIIRSVQTSSREIFSIRLYADNEAIYTRENRTIMNMSEIVQSDWYSSMLSNNDGIYCRPTYEHNYGDERKIANIISCVRPLQNGGVSGKVLGVVVLDIDEQMISQIIERTDITNSGSVYLIDNNGSVISALDKTKLGKPLDSMNTMPTRLWEQSEGTENIKIAGHSHIVTQKHVEGTGWRLVAIIPNEEILAQTSELARSLLIVLGIVVLLAIPTALWISNGMTRRIRDLLVQIRKIEDEKWEQNPPPSSSDEIGVLQNHLNRMSDNIQSLIREKYQEQVLKKSAELKALQAQINPHFLYNTLDMIHWQAMKHKAPDISEVVAQLAKFFRLSLSMGKDVITIRDELEHVRIYLDIQSRRFGGKIDYRIETDPDAESCATVKLILQPLVENAILHGIQERPDKTGTIIIKVEMDSDSQAILLSVSDDGVGMGAEQISKLTARPHTRGYGVWNVSEKIKLYFGEQYGLTFDSRLGLGTTVRIVIPAVLYSSLNKELE